MSKNKNNNATDNNVTDNVNSNLKEYIAKCEWVERSKSCGV